MKLSDLQPDNRNANKGTARGLKMIEASLQQDGFGRSILLDKEGRIIAGNKTAESVANTFGVDTEVVIVKTSGNKVVAVQREDLDLDDPDPNNPARRLAYRDNLTHEFSFALDPETVMADIEAGFDFEAIDIGLPDLGELLDGVDWQGDDNAGADTEPQIDKAEELRVKWGVEVGQLWALGEHRLICGDCTDAAVVERVMGGERAVMSVTSPPYSVGKNYETDSVDDWLALIKGLFKNIPASSIWVNLANKRTGNDGFERNTFFELAEIAEGQNYKMIGLRVWIKDPAWAGQSPYWRHTFKPVDDFEFVALFASEKPKYKSRLSDEENNSWGYRGVWDFGSVSKNKLHSAAYPLELPERCIKLTTDKTDIVYDPFSGSGTTIIACENLGRKARAIEIDPGYCAVTLERWSEHTGKQPQLLTD